MQKWFGSAAICINQNDELLMVLQGKPDEKKKWSVPSGGKEVSESLEECCLRELNEETGYDGHIVEKIKVKQGKYEELDLSYEVHYFLVKVVGGERRIQDPDQLIYDIDWKGIEEVKEINLSFPEDRDSLCGFVESHL